MKRRNKIMPESFFSGYKIKIKTNKEEPEIIRQFWDNKVIEIKNALHYDGKRITVKVIAQISDSKFIITWNKITGVCVIEDGEAYVVCDNGIGI